MFPAFSIRFLAQNSISRLWIEDGDPSAATEVQKDEGLADVGARTEQKPHGKRGFWL